MNSVDYDFVIVGSGFGGSVSALRLAEKGYRVAVIEMGRRVTPEAMTQAATNPASLFRVPALGWNGFFSQDLFQHVAVVRGIGVGGGSLVYAAVLLKPGIDFYQSPDWTHLADWQRELEPHYATASRMLGVAKNPRRSKMDDYLFETAEKLGCAASFNSVPQGIFFSEKTGTISDPYFEGQGPDRDACTFCGCCVSGCAVGAKNSLDKNYLFFAEQNGVEVFSELKVEKIEKTGDGYVLEARPVARGKPARQFRTRKIVLAGGVLGTLELLFKCRDHYKTLPEISARLGKKVRTNSEALVASTSLNRDEDLTDGATISSDFYFGSDTHITQNRLPPSHDIMRFYFGPMVNEDRPFQRALKTLVAYLLKPHLATLSWRKNWYRRTTLLTVMQNLDNALDFEFGRRWFRPWKKVLRSRAEPGSRAPTFIKKANLAAEALATVSGGVAQSIALESVGNMSLTAHILGGVCIGKDAHSGVVDSSHRLFAYPDIYVADASAIPANIGVNPSLTITAMAERMAALIPAVETRRKN